MRYLTILAALSLTACNQEPEPLDYNTAPHDPQVFNYVFQQCLTNSKGPQRTVYNDWDEAIEACKFVAYPASSYCPPKARCAPSVPSHSDVRAILP